MSQRPHEVYTHSHAPVVVEAHATRTAEEAAAFLLPHLGETMDILDVGCGPGSITVGLGRYAGSVVGIDQSLGVLAGARHRAAEAGADNVTFTAASAYTLPFADETFAVVYAHQVLQHLADPVAVLEEMRRVLVPGGTVAVRDADYGTMTHHPQDPVLDRWLEVYHQVARANGGEPDAGRRLLDWTLRAGFADAAATTSTWTFATPESRRWWADLWADRLVVDRLVLAAETHSISDRAELEKIGAAFRAWAAEPTGWFSFIHGEVLAHKPGR